MAGKGINFRFPRSGGGSGISNRVDEGRTNLQKTFDGTSSSDAVERSNYDGGALTKASTDYKNLPLPNESLLIVNATTTPAPSIPEEQSIPRNRGIDFRIPRNGGGHFFGNKIDEGRSGLTVEYTGTAEPNYLQSFYPMTVLTGVTWWGITETSNLQIDSNRVYGWIKTSGSAATNMGTHNGLNNMFTTSVAIAGYQTIMRSGSTSFLTASVAENQFISGTKWHLYMVAQIDFGTLSSSTRYTNHRLWADGSGWFGVYYRANPLGGATIDCYAWDTTQVTCSLDVAFGVPFLLEYWKSGSAIYARLNNSSSISASHTEVGTLTTVPYFGHHGSDSTSLFYLREFLVCNSDNVNSGPHVANWFAEQYQFSRLLSGAV